MSFGFGYFEIVLFLVPLTLTVASVAGLVYTWVRVAVGGKKANIHAPACCGACGYPARGVAELICSECGSDLREVGIVTPAKRKPMIGVATFFAFWLLCYPIPAVILAMLLIASGPTQSGTNESTTLIPTSGEYVEIMLDNEDYTSWGSFFFQAPMSGPKATLSVYIEGKNGQWEWLEVDATAMTYDATYATTQPYQPIASNNNTNTGFISGTTADPLNQAVILGWMQAVGADPTKPDVIAEADEVLQHIASYPTQGLQNLQVTAFQQTNQYSYPSDVPLLWWIVLVMLFVFAVWVLGGVLYFLIRRKRNLLPSVRSPEHLATAGPRRPGGPYPAT